MLQPPAQPWEWADIGAAALALVIAAAILDRAARLLVSWRRGGAATAAQIETQQRLLCGIKTKGSGVRFSTCGHTATLLLCPHQNVYCVPQRLRARCCKQKSLLKLWADQPLPGALYPSVGHMLTRAAWPRLRTSSARTRTRRRPSRRRRTASGRSTRSRGTCCAPSWAASATRSRPARPATSGAPHLRGTGQGEAAVMGRSISEAAKHRSRRARGPASCPERTLLPQDWRHDILKPEYYSCDRC